MVVLDLPCMDGRKSFYGKAQIIHENGAVRLLSYGTSICEITSDGKFLRLWNGWTQTTGRHINSFLEVMRQAGYYHGEGTGKTWFLSQPLKEV